MTIPLDVVPYTSLASNRGNLEDMLPLPMPLSMHIEPGNPCNFHCKSCPQYLDDYKDQAGYFQMMDWSLYEKIIRDVADMGRLKALKLFGYGEPLLHQRIADMVRLGKTVSDRVEFTSNVSLLTERMAHELIAAQLDYLRVSIYSMDQKRHDEFTGRKYSVDQIYQNVARLRRLRDACRSKRPFIYVKMFETVTPEEEAQFRERYAPVADEITTEVLHNMSGIGTERLGIAIPDRARRRVCPLPFYQSSVNAVGDVTICCIDWSWASTVGNLRTQSLREIWYSDALKEVRRKMLTGRRHEIESCRDCTWDWNANDNLENVSDETIERILGGCHGHATQAGQSPAVP